MTLLRSHQQCRRAIVRLCVHVRFRGEQGLHYFQVALQGGNEQGRSAVADLGIYVGTCGEQCPRYLRVTIRRCHVQRSVATFRFCVHVRFRGE
jgi:hypothetical protein